MRWHRWTATASPREVGSHMSEQPWQPDDPELESALDDLASRIVYPTAPDLADAVRDRLAARRTHVVHVVQAEEMGVAANHRRPTGPGPIRRGRRLRRGLALGAAALIVAIGATLGFSPSARTALATWLGLRAVAVVYQPALPTITPVGTHLGLGQRILIPTALGAPDEVYLSSATTDEVTLVYRPRPGLPRTKETGVGLLLVEHPGSLARGPAIFAKSLARGTRLDVTSIGHTPAYWFAGAPHLLWYTGGDNMPHEENVRLAGNVLLWERSGLILRLESALGEDAARRIATSVR